VLECDGPLRVLMVEDEPKLASLADQLLAATGCQTRVLTEAAEVVRTADQWRPDVVLLDRVLSGVPVGGDLTGALRAVTSAPIILITAQRARNGVPSGVERMVDDVLWKPFGAGDLLRRVQVAGARHRGGLSAGGGLIECGDLLVDGLHRRASLAGQWLILTSGEYALLRALAQQVNRQVPAEELLQTLGGPAYAGDLDDLHAYVVRLRQKIEADPANPGRLLAEGRGYRLVSPGAGRRLN
jgi:DNA-binding response OmpR family regulator